MPIKKKVFSSNDHDTWRVFLDKRANNIEKFACKEFLEGLLQLQLPRCSIPSYQYISDKLHEKTGWQIMPTDGLTEKNVFFHLLSQKIFPVAHKIRPFQQLEFYNAPDPDLIHDYFGHCPLLMNKQFANYMHEFGKMAITQSPQDRCIIDKFYWYTIEFGLIETMNGLRIYGAGILPSLAETKHAIQSKTAKRRLLDPIEIAKMSIEMHKKQPVYYIIKNFDQLYESLDYNWKEFGNEIRNYVN